MSDRIVGATLSIIFCRATHELPWHDSPLLRGSYLLSRTHMIAVRPRVLRCKNGFWTQDQQDKRPDASLAFATHWRHLWTPWHRREQENTIQCAGDATCAQALASTHHNHKGDNREDLACAQRLSANIGTTIMKCPLCKNPSCQKSHNQLGWKEHCDRPMVSTWSLRLMEVVHLARLAKNCAQTNHQKPHRKPYQRLGRVWLVWHIICHCIYHQKSHGSLNL